MKGSPCKGCQDRTVEPNCHITCEEYIAYQLRVEQSKKTLAELEAEYAIKSRSYDNVGKKLKKRRT